MLTFRISPPKATPKEGEKPEVVTNIKEYLSRDHILARQVARCPFVVGDKVSVKGQPYGKNRGKVIDLITDARDVRWLNGGKQPAFVVVEIPLKGNVGEVEMHYGYKTVACPMKILNKVQR